MGFPPQASGIVPEDRRLIPLWGRRGMEGEGLLGGWLKGWQLPDAGRAFRGLDRRRADLQADG